MFELHHRKISIDLLVTTFVVAFVGLFLLANYFAGFNLPLYMVTMMIGSALVLLHPHAGLYACIVLTFLFERFFTLVPVVFGRTEYKLYPIDVLLGAMLVGILFQIASRKIKLQLKKIDYAIIVFIVLSLSYFFVSTIILKNNASLAFSSSKNYAYYALLYFAAFILIDSKQRLIELAQVVFAGAVGILWFVFYGIAAQHGLWSDFTPLSTDGIRTLAFTHAFYLSMVLIISLVYIAYRSDRFSRLLLILMPLWGIGVVGSMMRHLWISLFAAVMFLAIKFTITERKRLQRYARTYMVWIFCIIVVALYVATLFPRSSAYASMMSGLSMLQDRVVSISNPSSDESMAWRSAVWQQSFKQYLRDPLFGIGYGKFVSVEIGTYHDFVEVRNIHNSFLVVLVQMGLVGLFSLLVAMFVLAKHLVFQKNFSETEQIAVYAALAILLMQVIAFMFQPYLEANLLSIFFWINLGVLRRMYQQTNELI